MMHVRIIQVRDVKQARAIAGKLVPFRAPHWTASARGHVQEVGLAAGGVLYLDEPADVRRVTIEAIALKLEQVERPPLAVILKDENPFRPDGPEPNEGACARYARRLYWAHDLLVRAAGERDDYADERTRIGNTPEDE